MQSNDKLGWRDVGRGLLTLASKAPALVKTAATMGLTRDSTATSVATRIEKLARQRGQSPAVKSADGDVTYGQLNARANRTARLLLHQGVCRGDTVAVMMENRPELLISVLACAKIGAVAAMINVHQRKQALAHAFRCAPPAWVMCGEECLDAYLEVATESPLGIVADPTMPSRAPWPVGSIHIVQARTGYASSNPPTTHGAAFSDPFLYIFTSGTTGLPKASVMSHRRWVGAGLLFGEVCLQMRPGETLYCPLPLYHNQALTTCWSSAVQGGAALAIRRRFSARQFWEDCRRFDARAIAYIGQVATYLLAQPPTPQERVHRVRRAVGLGMRAELWQPFKDRFGLDAIYEFYGASELNVGFVNLMNLDRTVGICPGPWAIVAYDIETGEPLRDGGGRLIRLSQPGDVGLLVTRVNERFKFEGYTDAQASERKLLRDAFESSDCWVNTGDVMRRIGFGHLQFVDRLGDTFRWKGENVATGQVEAVLGSLDGVLECTVFGVTVPGLPGRAGMAAIVAEGEGTPELEGMLKGLVEELPSYAVPVFLRFVPSLAVTGTFKHRKTELRREGFDPGQTGSHPVFVRVGDSYKRVDDATYTRLCAGEVRL